MPQQLGVHPLLQKTGIRQLTTTCNSSSRGSESDLWPLWAPVLMCIHTETNILK